MISQESIKIHLKQIIDPDTGLSLIALGIISSIIIRDGRVGFVLEFADKEQAIRKDYLRTECERVIKGLPGVTKVTVVSTYLHSNKKEIPAIYPKIIVIASGKGGVGKSTLALHIALSLLKLNYKVALIDADIYGPSIPQMIGAKDCRPSQVDHQLLPILKYGLKTMSMGYLVDESKATVWRGPMVTKMLNSLIKMTAWGEIDYLVVDTPPGTGDVHLTLAEKFPISGVIAVSTPQELALIDVRKMLNMFIKLNVKISGIIENMSFFIDPVSQNKSYIFGKHGALNMACEMEIPFLGEVPIDLQIGIAAEQGDPRLLSQNIQNVYLEITKKMLNEIAGY